MPQKSNYIQAPYTLNDYTQSLKEGFSFLGFDTLNTAETDFAFDSDYWLSKRTVSNKNKIIESEQLIFPTDFTDLGWNGTYASGAPSVTSAAGWGSEAYVRKASALGASTTALNVDLVSVLEPRFQTIDSYLRGMHGGFKASTQYTFSFYARSTYGGGQVTLNVGSDVSTNARIYGTDVKLGDLNSNWNRYQYTFTTGASTNIGFHVGGWTSWSAIKPTLQFSTATEDINQYWIQQTGVSVTPNYERVYPNISASYNGCGDADLVTFNTSSNNSIYKGIVAYTINGSNDVVASPVANRTFTMSFWARKVAGTGAYGYMTNAASDVSSFVYIDDTNWKRYSVTYTFAAGSTGTNINHHFAATASGTSIAVWGIQVEEGSVATSYKPNRSTTQFSGRAWGDMQMTGFQIEEGATATAYEPVRSWHMKESALSLDETVTSSTGTIHYNIPGGIAQSFISCRSGDTASPNNSWFGGTGANRNPLRQNEGGEINFWTDLDCNGYYSQMGYNVSSTTFFQSMPAGSNHRMSYASDIVRGVVGNYNSNTSPMGTCYKILGSNENDTSVSSGNFFGNFTNKVKLDCYGVVFKVAKTGTDIGLTSAFPVVKGYGFTAKTPGNGRRKMISTSIREGTDGKVYITQSGAVFQINAKSGVAESAGFLVPTWSGWFQGVTDTTNVLGTRLNQYFPGATEASYSVSFPKNTDLFAFAQGSTDGFLYSLNQNSTFIYSMSAADFINPLYPQDDGSVYSRHGYILTQYGSEERSVAVSAHGPLVGNNLYGVNVSYLMKTGKSSNFFTSQSVPSPLHDVYGDDYIANVTPNTIQQCYVTLGIKTIGSSRGILSNMFVCKVSAFSGNAGDLLLGVDGAKYFNYYKATFSGNSNSIALFVKV